MKEPPEIENFFVCVGAQKAGTTWLMKMLSRHPEVFVTPVKEIHYFDHIAGLTTHLRDGKRRSRYRKYFQRLLTQWHRWPEFHGQRAWYRAYMREALDDHWYASLFAERGGRAIAGEATPEYAIVGEDGFRHIARLAPRARLVYIMRNPVTRAWSQILHQCRSNRVDAARMSTQELMAIAGTPRFGELSDYIATLDAMQAVFPESQIWLGYYEDIHADRLAALEEICRFLGVGFDRGQFRDLDKRVNVSQSVEMPEDVRAALRGSYRELAVKVRERVGKVPQSWLDEFDLPGQGPVPG